jgi:hypothetical protein
VHSYGTGSYFCLRAGNQIYRRAGFLCLAPVWRMKSRQVYSVPDEMLALFACQHHGSYRIHVTTQ